MSGRLSYFIFGVAAFLGTFFPIVRIESECQLGLEEIGGLYYPLYVLPLALIALAALNIRRTTLPYVGHGFLLLGFAGLLIGIIVSFSALQDIRQIAVAAYRFEPEVAERVRLFRATREFPCLDTGALLILGGYLGIIGTQLIDTLLRPGIHKRAPETRG